MQINWPKLITANVAIIMIGLGVLIGRIDPAVGLPPISVLATYVLANGNAARKGITPDPVIGPKPPA